MNVLHKKSIGYLIFCVALGAFFLLFHLNQYIFLRPQSIHIWRQTDCLSITQRYFQDKTSFCEPEIYNHLADGGHTGKSAGEFPGWYYLMAQFWKLFGKHEWLYRAMVFVVFSGACLALFKMAIRTTQNIALSIFFSLLLFTSPTIAYYSISFLTNIPALSFVIIGWLFVYRFYESKKNIHIGIAMSFFTIGMLLKVTVGISFVALLGWCVLELFLKTKEKLFNGKFIYFVYFLISAVIVFGWYWYAEHYNSIHQGKYTFNGIWPIWDVSSEKMDTILNHVNKIWMKEYYHQSLLYLTGLVWVFLLMQPRKIPAFLYYLLIVMPLGGAIYLLLWFQALESHDYYLIDLFILIILVWAVFLFRYREQRWMKSRFTSLLFAVYLVFLGFNCRKRIDERYNGWMNDWYKTKLEAVGELEPYLERWGVTKDDLVISTPDNTINGTLYLMNRKGFNNYGNDLSQPATFSRLISLGARYLVVNDTTIVHDEPIKHYTAYPVGTYRNVSVFDLRPFGQK